MLTGSERWYAKLPAVLTGTYLRAADTETRQALVSLLVLGAVLAGLLLAAVNAAADPFMATSYGPGHDARAYWAASSANPYVRSVGREGAYLYSPAFLQLMEPLRALHWPTFLSLWTGLLLGALLALGGPILFLPLLGIAFIELWGGNIHLLLALAIVVGFRFPAAWSFVLLTKVTPGIGLLWFAVRREWRSLGIALGATVALAAVSALVVPQQWAEWLSLLGGSTGATTVGVSVPIPLIARVPLAVVLVIWAARTNRAWAVPVAAMLALPVLWWGGLTMAIGAVALQRPVLERWFLARLASRPAGGQRPHAEPAGA